MKRKTNDSYRWLVLVTAALFAQSAMAEQGKPSVLPTIAAIVLLRSAQMNLVRSTVSSVVDVNLSLFRSMSLTATPWQANSCFELQIESPYADPMVYESFKNAQPPECDSQAIRVDCYAKKSDTLVFSFGEVDAYAAAQQSISFSISNFHTPYSDQKLSGIKVTSFSDAECSLDAWEVRVSPISIQPAFLPDSSIKIETSSDKLGAEGKDNSLIVSFTPQTQMSPTRKGAIELGIPFLWQMGMKNEIMYDGNAEDECSSQCMTITSSRLKGTLIRISYVDMLDSCLTGAQITIECAYFRNPIYQDTWHGFYVKTLDEQGGEIDVSGLNPSLDATQYKPKLLTSNEFFVMPGDRTIATKSEWIFQLYPPIPMITECYIKLEIPLDLPLKWDSIFAEGMFLPKNLNSILANGDFVLTQSNTEQSITFAGCNDELSLGKEPHGTLFFSQIESQSSVRDSGDFKLIIYKDELQTQLIAELEGGFRLQANDISPGILTKVQVYPQNYRVQTETFVYFRMTISHRLNPGSKVEINLPKNLVIGSQLSVIGLTTESSSPNPSTFATVAQITGDHTIEIQKLVSLGTVEAGYEFWFIIDGLQTQTSAKDAGSFQLTTYEEVDSQFYIVDFYNSAKSFQATPGYISAVADISINVPLVGYSQAVYDFSYEAESRVPANGFIKITFPPSVTFDSQQIVTSCSENVCSVNGQTIVIRLKEDLLRNVTFSLGGIKNPRSLQPSDSFLIETFDTDGVSKIDIGFYQSVQMAQAGTITDFIVTRESEVNGVVNTYTIVVESSVPFAPYDSLKFTLPQEVQANSGNRSVCDASGHVKCSVSDKDVTVIILKPDLGNTLVFKLTNIQNPISMAPTEGFYDIKLQDSDQYLVAQTSLSLAPLQNTQPAKFKQTQLTQASYVLEQVNQYTLTFTPSSAVPPQTAFKLDYPGFITLQPSTKCTVTTNQVFVDKCTIHVEQRQITVSGAFVQTSGEFSSQVTITLSDVTNPRHTKGITGFNLRTYADADFLYLMDAEENVMVPRLTCNYPCATCRSDDPNLCTSCYADQSDFPKFLMAYSETETTCKEQCDVGFTTNGSENLACIKCDDSCMECKDDGMKGDVKKCTVCAADYPFTHGETCLKSCNQGLYLEKGSDFQCSVCDGNCYTCDGQADTCTSCKQSSGFPSLLGSQCVAACPDGMLNIKGVCELCDPSCHTCEGGKSRCLSCDTESKMNIFFAYQCFDVCPAGYATEYTTLECLSCSTGCDECDLQNVSKCFRCLDPLVLYEGECVSSCPGGMLPGPENIGCFTTTLKDMSLLYFPFLIAGALFAFIASCGRLKTKFILVNGLPSKKSEQRTLTTLIAFIAPLQTNAMIAQCVWAMLYGFYLHMLASLAIVALIVAFNVYFCVWYYRTFVRCTLPQVGSRVRVGKRNVLITQQNRKRYSKPLDYWFYQHRTKHRYSTFVVLGASLVCHFQVTKLLYSRFQGFDVFKAQWTQAERYAAFMKKFQYIYLVLVEIPLIAVSALGITQVPQSTQLHITLWETALITLALVLMTLVEQRNLQNFGNDRPNKYRALAMKDWSRVRMKNMILKVRKAEHFQVRKIDEILLLFGERHCKSAIELKGQARVDDPRLLYTWPVSPDHMLDLVDQGVKTFDAPKDEFVGSLPRDEFMAILARKQATTLSRASCCDLGELEKARMQQKRGRKNKYRRYVDDEDDQDQVTDEFAKLLAQKAFEESQLEQLMQISKQKQADLEKVRSSPASSKRSSLFKITKPSAEEMLRQVHQKATAKKSKKVTVIKPADASTTIQLKEMEATVMDLRPLHIDMQKPSKNHQKKAVKSSRNNQVKQTTTNDSVQVNQNALKPFLSSKILKPDVDLRNFNEHDILGDLAHDKEGNLVLYRNKKNQLVDMAKRPVTSRGYLLNPKTGDIISHKDGNVMFKKAQLLKDMTLPAPYCLEKHNFNAHLITGSFDFNGKPQIQSSGLLKDKNGKIVNKHGFYVESGGHVVDNYGHRKFSSDQLVDGDLHMLLTLDGKQFDIRQVMGSVEKDEFGDLVITSDYDLQGRPINTKGYLVNSFGDIIDSTGEVLFRHGTLKSGEFIKIFPYSTKFCPSLCKGDLTRTETINGRSYDAQKRLINEAGYLVDTADNIVDQNGNVMFAKAMLAEDGDIPAVFRSEIQKEGTSISRLMSEIDRIHEEGQPPDGIFDESSQSGGDEIVQNVQIQKRNRTVVKTIESVEMAGGDQELALVQQAIQVKNQVQPKEQNFRVESEPQPSPQKHNSASESLIKPSTKILIEPSKGFQDTKITTSPPLHEPSQEFERLYGKNLDKFLEDSEWDIESLDKMSWSDDQQQQQVEEQLLQLKGASRKKKPKRVRKIKQKPPDRVTLIHQTDDPVSIHHGALLEFKY